MADAGTPFDSLEWMLASMRIEVNMITSAIRVLYPLVALNDLPPEAAEVFFKMVGEVSVLESILGRTELLLALARSKR